MAGRISRVTLAQYIVDHLSTAQRGDVLQQVAAYLIDTKRTKELELIVRDVQRLLADGGNVSAIAISAFTLSDAVKTELTAFIKKQTNAKTVSIENIIDESVIGGVKLNLPGRELDQTIARQLTTLRTEYKKA